MLIKPAIGRRWSCTGSKGKENSNAKDQIKEDKKLGNSHKISHEKKLTWILFLSPSKSTISLLDHCIQKYNKI